MEVICDLCNTAYTEYCKGHGGFVTHTWAVCPTCAPNMLSSMEKENETHHIHFKQAENESFHDFIMRVRLMQHLGFRSQ